MSKRQSDADIWQALVKLRQGVVSAISSDDPETLWILLTRESERRTQYEEFVMEDELYYEEVVDEASAGAAAETNNGSNEAPPVEPQASLSQGKVGQDVDPAPSQGTVASQNSEAKPETEEGGSVDPSENPKLVPKFRKVEKKHVRDVRNKFLVLCKACGVMGSSESLQLMEQPLFAISNVLESSEVEQSYCGGDDPAFRDMKIPLLNYAVMKGSMKCVSFLLRQGINKESRGDVRLRTPLMEAVDREDMKMMKVLDEHEVSYSSGGEGDSRGHHIIHMACRPASIRAVPSKNVNIPLLKHVVSKLTAEDTLQSTINIILRRPDEAPILPLGVVVSRSRSMNLDPSDFEMTAATPTPMTTPPGSTQVSPRHQRRSSLNSVAPQSPRQERRSSKSVAESIEKNEDPKESVMKFDHDWLARVRKRFPDKMKVLKAERDIPEKWDRSVESLWPTALHLCCWQGSFVAVKMLVEAGAVLDPLCGRGETPVFWAFSRGEKRNFECAEYLMEQGSDKHHRNYFGHSLLHHLPRFNCFSNFLRLIVVFKNVDLPDSDGNSPLFHAACAAHPICFNALLSREVNVLRFNRWGQNVLHHIARGRGKKADRFTMFTSLMGVIKNQIQHKLARIKMDEESERDETESMIDGSQPSFPNSRSVSKAGFDTLPGVTESDGENEEVAQGVLQNTPSVTVLSAAPDSEFAADHSEDEDVEDPSHPDKGNSVGLPGHVNNQAGDESAQGDAREKTISFSDEVNNYMLEKQRGTIGGLSARQSDPSEADFNNLPVPDALTGVMSSMNMLRRGSSVHANIGTSWLADRRATIDTLSGPGAARRKESVDSRFNSGLLLDSASSNLWFENKLTSMKDFACSLDTNGLSPLAHAVKRGHVQLVSLIIEEFPESSNEANLGRNSSHIVHIAAAYSNVETVDALLKSLEIEEVSPNDDCLTPLQISIKAFNIPVAALLLERFPEWLFEKDLDYISPLMEASRIGETKFVISLLDKLDKVIPSGEHDSYNGYSYAEDVRNAIEAAAKAGHDDVCKMMIKRKKSFLKLDADIMKTAATRGIPAVITAMMELNVPIEYQENDDADVVSQNLLLLATMAALGKSRTLLVKTSITRRQLVKSFLETILPASGPFKLSEYMIEINGLLVDGADIVGHEEDMLKLFLPWMMVARCATTIPVSVAITAKGVGLSQDHVPSYDQCIVVMLDLLKKLSKDPTIIFSRIVEGTTVIHEAARRGYTKPLKHILDMQNLRSEDIVNVRSELGETALHAVGQQYCDCNCSSCCKVEGECCRCSVCSYCSPPNTDISDIGVDFHGGFCHSTSRIYSTDHVKCINLLLRYGFSDVATVDNNKETWNPTRLSTPLHLAIKAGPNGLQVCKSLIARFKRGDNLYEVLRIKDGKGRTCLHEAVVMGYEEMVATFMEAIAAGDEKRAAAAAAAAKKKKRRKSSVKPDDVILPEKSVIDLEDLDGRTPLALAVHCRRYRCLELFMRGSVQTWVNDHEGSLLHAAIDQCALDSEADTSVSVVKVLLNVVKDKGRRRKKDGLDAYRLAVAQQCYKCQRILVDYHLEYPFIMGIDPEEEARKAQEELEAATKGTETDADDNVVAPMSASHSAMLSGGLVELPDEPVVPDGELEIIQEPEPPIEPLSIATLHDIKAVQILVDARPALTVTRLRDQLGPFHVCVVEDYGDTLDELMKYAEALSEKLNAEPTPENDEQNGNGDGAPAEPEEPQAEPVLVDVGDWTRRVVDMPAPDGSTLFFNIAKYGRLSMMQTLLGSPLGRWLDVNHIDENGYNALHVTLKNGSFDLAVCILNTLQELGIDFNTSCKAKDGTTALQLAIDAGSASVITALVQNPKTDLTIINPDGKTYLESAMQKGEEFGCILLEGALQTKTKLDVSWLDKGGLSYMHRAIEYNQPGVICRLMKFSHLDVDRALGGRPRPLIDAILNQSDPACGTALLDTCRELGRPIDVTTRDADGKVPIDLAVLQNQPKIVEALMKMNETPYNNRDNAGNFPLHTAIAAVSCCQEKQEKRYFEKEDGSTSDDEEAESCATALLRLALERGVADLNINEADTDGLIPLILAIKSGCSKIVKLLLKFPYLDVNFQSSLGRPLDAAFAQDYQLLAYLLLFTCRNDSRVIDITYAEPDLSFVHVALEKGWAHVLKELMLADVDVNAPNDAGMSSLSHALALCALNPRPKNAVECTEILLRDGITRVDVNSPSDGKVPIVKAICEDLPTIVELMMSYEALDITAVDEDSGLSLLHLALKRCHNEDSDSQRCAVTLLEASLERSLPLDVTSVDDNQREPLILAEASDLIKIVSLLIQFEAVDPNNGALISAVQNRHYDIVRYFLDSPGIDVNCSTLETKDTPLMIAAKNNDPKMCQLICERSVENRLNLDEKAKNSESKTALCFAIEYGDVEVLDVLVSRESASLNNVNAEGDTALQVCYVRDKSKCRELQMTLLEAASSNHIPLDVNFPNKDGRTQLITAINEQDEDRIALLLKCRGVDLMLTDESGRNSFQIAIFMEDQTIMKLILQAALKYRLNLDVNLKDPIDSSFPIMKAMQNNWHYIIELLTRFEHVDINMMDENGRTALVSGLLAGNEVPKRFLELVKENHVILDVNLVDKELEIPPLLLLAGSERTSTDLFQKFLEFDEIDLSVYDENRANALILCIKRLEAGGSTPMFRTLMNSQYGKHVDANHKDVDGSAVYHAIVTKQIDILDRILQIPNISIGNVSAAGESALQVAVQTRNIDNVQRLCRRAKEFDLDLDINKADDRGWTVLHHAVAQGSERLVETLIEVPGINVNATDLENRSPLFIGLLGEERLAMCLKCIILSNLSIDVVTKDSDGSILYHLIMHKNTDLLDLVLRKREVNLKSGINDVSSTRENVTALQLCVEHEVTSALAVMWKYLIDTIDKPIINFASVGPRGTVVHECSQRRLVESLQNLVLFEDFGEVDINVQDVDGNTGLHLCVQLESIEALDILLQCDRIHMGIQNNLGETPLHVAVKKTKEPSLFIDAILSKEYRVTNKTVDASKRDEDGKSPLYYAMVGGMKEVIDMLIERKEVNVDSIDEENTSALSIAISKWVEDGNSELTENILKKCRRVRKSINIDVTDPVYGRSVLHFSVQFGAVQIAQALLQYNEINLDIQDNNGQTAIVQALARPDDLIVARSILSSTHPCNINLKDNRGSAMLYALETEDYEIIDLVLKCDGLNVSDILTEEKATAAQVAYYRGDFESFFKILDTCQDNELGLQINLQDGSGRGTLMHQCINDGRNDVLERLVGFPGIDCNVYNPEGKTPLSLTIAKCDLEAAKLILSIPSADLSVASCGQVPLYQALLTLDEPDEFVQTLLEFAHEHGTLDPNWRDASGKSSLEVAVERRLDKLIASILALDETVVDPINDSNQSALELAFPSWIAQEGNSTVIVILSSTLEKQKSLDINRVNESGLTVLHHAVMMNDPEVVEMLLKFEDIDLNFQDVDMKTPLMYAICHESRDMTIATMILASSHPRDVNLRDREGTAVYHAIVHDQIEVLRTLVKVKTVELDEVDGARTAGQVALELNRIECLFAVWDGCMASIRSKMNFNAMGEDGTILHYIVKRSMHECLGAILRVKFVDPNRLNQNKKTAIHLALENSDIKSFDLLLKFEEINLRLTDGNECSPLHYCINKTADPNVFVSRLFDRDIVLRNPRHTVEVNRWDSTGQSPLYYAIRKNLIRVVDMLLKRPRIEVAQINQAGDSAFDTALEYWMETSDQTIIVCILDACLLNGMDCRVNRTEKSSGRTILQIAVSMGQQDVVARILKFPGVDLNSLDLNQQSALSIAIRHGYEEIAHMILECPGVDVNIKDFEGSALYHSIVNNQVEVMKRLMNVKGIELNDIMAREEDEEETTCCQIALRKEHYDCLMHILRIVVEGTLSLNVNSNGPEGNLLHQIVLRKQYKALKNITKILTLEIGWMDESGRSALHVAIEADDLHATELLLSCIYINIGTVDSKNQTILHYVLHYTENPLMFLELLLRKDKRLFRGKLNTNDRDENGKSVIALAIEMHHADVVPLLVGRKEAAVNKINDKNQSCLELAMPHWIETRDKSIVHSILKVCLEAEKKLDVNRQDETQRTCLHYALEFDELDLVDLLIQYPNLSLNIRDENGMTPLVSAIVKYPKNNKIALSMLEKVKDLGINVKDNVGGNAAYYSIMQGDTELLTAILRTPGVDPNDVCTGTSKTAAQIALESGKFQLLVVIMHLVLSVKLDMRLDLTDLNGNLVHECVRNRQYAALELLFLMPASQEVFDARDNDGNTPLHIAVENDDTHVVTMLLSSIEKFDMSQTNNLNRNLVHQAILYANDPVRVIHRLARKDERSQGSNPPTLDFNVKDAEGNSPMVYAILSHKGDVIEALLENEATEVNDIAAQGKTALEVATPDWLKEGDDVTILRVLRMCLKHNKSLNVNSVNLDNKTVLHRAIERNEPLVARGVLGFPDVNLNIQDSEGYTALHRAMFLSHAVCADLLMAYAQQHRISLNMESILEFVVSLNDVEFLQKVVKLSGLGELRPDTVSKLLSTACRGGDGAVFILLLETLLEQDVKVDFPPGVMTGRVDMLYAVIKNDMVALENILKRPRLHEAKKLANTCGMDGRTVVEHALIAGHTKVLECLLEYGADLFSLSYNILTLPVVEGREDIGIFLLEYAEKHSELMKKLLSQRNIEGATALHVSASMGNVRLTKALIHYGADITLTDNYGQTPLHCAVQTNFGEATADITNMLLYREGSPLYTSDNNGHVPGHLARGTAKAKIAKAMVKKRTPALLHLYYCNDCEELHGWHVQHSSQDYLWHAEKLQEVVDEYFEDVRVMLHPINDPLDRSRTNNMPFGSFEVYWEDAINGSILVSSKVRSHSFPNMRTYINLLIDALICLENGFMSPELLSQHNESSVARPLTAYPNSDAVIIKPTTEPSYAKWLKKDESDSDSDDGLPQRNPEEVELFIRRKRRPPQTKASSPYLTGPFNVKLPEPERQFAPRPSTASSLMSTSRSRPRSSNKRTGGSVAGSRPGTATSQSVDMGRPHKLKPL